MEAHTTLLQRLSNASQSLTNQYLLSARETLLQLASVPNLLGNLSLTRADGGYTRNLIFADNRMSAWAMVWAPGARTPIHDHHCSCCFTVVQGTICEVWFDAVDDSRAIKSAEHRRTPGYVTSMTPSGPCVHQMINDGPEDAVSIHIYGYDHRLHVSSIHREYQQIEH